MKGFTMQKTAQKRSVLNKLREMTNVSGIAAEKFFNPEFQKVMESLREKDNAIRALVSGQEIEGADPGPDPISLKDLLKSSKSNFNRREYMTSVAELGRFHKKLFDVIQSIKNLSLDVDAVHHEFLFKDLGDEHKKQLEELKNRFAQNKIDTLVKEANIMDFFYNIGTKRGRALAAWEKRYPKQIGKLKKDTSMLLTRSEAILGQVLSALKEMAAARATRNIDNYMKGADKISKAYVGYDKTFKEYYSSNIKGFLEKIELVSPTDNAPESKELGSQEITTAPKEEDTTPSLSPESNIPIPLTQVKAPSTIPQGPPDMASNIPFAATSLHPEKMPSIPPSAKVPTQMTPATMEQELPQVPSLNVPATPAGTNEEFKSDQMAKDMWGKASHLKFLESLESFAGESPLLLASYIKKYAKSIQGTNPEAAIELFKIVRSIRG